MVISIISSPIELYICLSVHPCVSRSLPLSLCLYIYPCIMFVFCLSTCIKSIHLQYAFFPIKEMCVSYTQQIALFMYARLRTQHGTQLQLYVMMLKWENIHDSWPTNQNMATINPSWLQYSWAAIQSQATYRNSAWPEHPSLERSHSHGYLPSGNIT